MIKKIFIFLICCLLFPGVTGAFTPNDPYFSLQWYLQKIEAPAAWDLGFGTHEVVVAVIDAASSFNHEDINYFFNKNEIAGDGIDNDGNGYVDDVLGWDFVDGDNDVSPNLDLGGSSANLHHGTIVAGIIAAIGNNQAGIVGINWKIKIMPLRVIDYDGVGNDYNAAAAIRYALANGARVINMSLVSVNSQVSPVLGEAIKEAYQKNVLVVVAAGNGSQSDLPQGINLNETPLFPVCYKFDGEAHSVIGVAAVNENDVKCDFSNFGQNCVLSAAPGVGIFSTQYYLKNHPVFNAPYGGFWSGTSFSAPLVTGAVAYMKAIAPELTSQEQIKLLEENSDDISNVNPNYVNQVGKRLNLYKLVKAVYEREAGESGGYLVAPAGGASPLLSVLNSQGKITSSFYAYDKNLRMGLNFTLANLFLGQEKNILVGTNSGAGPEVAVFDLQGKLQTKFYAYDKNFKGGVFVTAGDINGDGQNEIITGAGAGGGPQVRIFDKNGKVLGQFFAYDTGFKGGVAVMSGDVNGDGQAEIITAPAGKGGPQVRIFDKTGKVLGQFFAYDKNFKGGVTLAVADINKDGKVEIITAAGSGGGPQVRVFDLQGRVLGQFFAYDKNFRGGLNIAVVKTSGQDFKILVAAKTLKGFVRVFDLKGKLEKEIFPYGSNFTNGVWVGAI